MIKKLTTAKILGLRHTATRRGSPKSLSRKKKKHDKQDGFDSSLEQDSKLGENGNEGEIHSSSSLAIIPRTKRNVFEDRLLELAALKAKHGHCNAPATPSSEYCSLGCWCSNMRTFHKKLQERKTPRCPLSQDQSGRLEALGFEWSKRQEASIKLHKSRYLV